MMQNLTNPEWRISPGNAYFPSMKTLLKTSLVSTIALLALATGSSAKVIGSGNVTTETRSVGGFHGVDLRNTGNVIVTQGDTEGLTIEGEDNILPLIETTVADGTLRIGFKDREEIHLTRRLVFRLSVKTLDSVLITGSGDITAQALKAERFAVKVLGSGNIGVDHLESGVVTVAIDGSGSVKLAGKAASQTVSVNGSGDYDAAGLKTGAATLNVAGSGDCEVSASETLDVSISGSGDVSYYGKPALTKHVSGSGSIDALGAGK